MHVQEVSALAVSSLTCCQQQWQEAQTSPTQHHNKLCCPSFVAVAAYAAVPAPEGSVGMQLGKELRYAPQFTSSFLANWLKTSDDVREGRAGNIRHFHCREKPKKSTWDSARASDVWAERRWMEPCKSSAHFPGESSTSVTEGLPEQARWGNNFPVILGHAQDLRSLRTWTCQERNKRFCALQSRLCKVRPTCCSRHCPELSPLPYTWIQQIVQRTQQQIKKFELLLWRKLFQVLKWEKWQPFSTICWKG